MQIPKFEGNIRYEYRYPLARHLHSSRDACACIGTRKDAGGARRRVFAQIYNPTSKRTSERAEGVVWEWVMIHSPAYEAFRDRWIRRDPETAEPSGSSEREQNVARRVSSIESSRVLPRVLLEFLALDADAGRRALCRPRPCLLFRWIIYDSSGASGCLTRYTANYTDKECSTVALWLKIDKW